MMQGSWYGPAGGPPVLRQPRAWVTVRPPTTGSDPPATPWAESYPAGVPATYRYPAVPATRLLDDAAQDFPETVAIEYHGYRLSYRKLLDHTDRFTTALAARGIGPGRRVAVMLPNCPQLVIAVFAVWRLGAAVVLGGDAHRTLPPPPSMVVTTERRRPGSEPALPADAEIIVTRRADYLPFPRNAVAQLRAALRGHRPRLGRTRDVQRFAHLVRRNPPAAEESPQAVTRTAVSRHGADVSQEQLVVNSFQLRLWLPDVVAGDERVLLSVPLTSPAGITWLLTSVLSAATMILVDGSRSARRQRAAVRARPTILPLQAAVVDDLLRASWRRGHLGSVRFAVSTDRLDDRAVAQLEELTDKGRVRHAWGIDGVLTHADPIYGRAEHGSVGLPLPDTALVVADAHGAGVDPGFRGRLWLRGPQLCGDTWVDARVDATLTDDGYLFVHDDAAGAGHGTSDR